MIYAIIVASLVLSLGMAIAQMTIEQLKNTTSVMNSLEAFYRADIFLACSPPSLIKATSYKCAGYSFSSKSYSEITVGDNVPCGYVLGGEENMTTYETSYASILYSQIEYIVGEKDIVKIAVAYGKCGNEDVGATVSFFDE